jgi:hypothetical protein
VGVKLTKRPAPAADALVEDHAVDDAAEAATKGRPTPKRRDSTVRRGPVTAPKTRKEAYARQKEQAKAARSVTRKPAASMTAVERRAALRAGDPSVLPRRDQGATRKLARDYVDSHRMASNYLLLLFPLMIVSYVIPYVQFAVIFVFLGLLIEWNLTGRKIRKLATERFGKADGGNMGIGFYAGSRAYLPRRWRLPAPQVSRGDEI